MTTQVYVGNLDPQTSSDEVLDAFSAQGCRPKEVKLVRDALTGRRRGFGFHFFTFFTIFYFATTMRRRQFSHTPTLHTS